MPLFVFDLDGTLVDSRRDLAESANELLAAYDAPPLSLEAVTGMVGEGARVLVERVFAAAGGHPAVPPGALDRFLEIYERHLVVHTRLYVGVVEALDVLSDRASLAVLTNKPGAHTRLLLEALGIASRFQWVLGGDSPFPRKPDPSSLRHLMHAAGTTTTTTVMVGDSMVDIETARQAPTRMCLALYGFGQFSELEASGPGRSVVRRSADLPEACAALVDDMRTPH